MIYQGHKHCKVRARQPADVGQPGGKHGVGGRGHCHGGCGGRSGGVADEPGVGARLVDEGELDELVPCCGSAEGGAGAAGGGIGAGHGQEDEEEDDAGIE